MNTMTPKIKYGINGDGCMNGHIRGDRNRIADSPLHLSILPIRNKRET
jgi:hypothetical protein